MDLWAPADANAAAMWERHKPVNGADAAVLRGSMI